MNKDTELKHDEYRVARGGDSRLLSIKCRKCDADVCTYQKDGPGELRRLYVDRMLGSSIDTSSELTCAGCSETLAVKILYKKESRPAYRLFAEAVTHRDFTTDYRESTRTLHAVTCKAALFNPDHSKVILVEYNANNFGLPGGHMDAGESPDEAMHRELSEELGLSDLNLQRSLFLQHPEGKIVLGYTGIVDENATMTIDPIEVGAYHWVSIEDIRAGIRSAGAYDEIILAVNH